MEIGTPVGTVFGLGTYYYRTVMSVKPSNAFIFTLKATEVFFLGTQLNIGGEKVGGLFTLAPGFVVSAHE